MQFYKSMNKLQTCNNEAEMQQSKWKLNKDVVKKGRLVEISWE